MTGAAAFVPVSLPGPTGLITNTCFRSPGRFLGPPAVALLAPSRAEDRQWMQ